MIEKKIRRHFLVGIDTACDKRFSYIVFGPKDSVNKLETDIKHICLKNGIRKIHFNDIDSDKRKIIYPEIAKIVLEYGNITYDVLEHKKPSDYPAKDFYLNFLPREYAKLLDFLKNKGGVIRIDIHDDFSVSGVANSTDHLLDSLLITISRQSAGGSENAAIFRKNDVFNSKVICKETGNVLYFNLRKMQKQTSSAINVADIVLGFHQLKFKTRNSVFSATTFDKAFLKKVFYKNLIPSSP
jgi:hypothetical protein